MPKSKTSQKKPKNNGALRMTTAEATVAGLLAHGIDTLYALPGLHNDHLFDALFRAADRTRTVHTRHEQGSEATEHKLQILSHLVMWLGGATSRALSGP